MSESTRRALILALCAAGILVVAIGLYVRLN
jgi:hypothetical protein